ncbi:MAG: hypothetical protein P1Q69_10530 [Candidatus Thorarchaeota archaeon]|nr:hypothetical protein [Candidatus Thorarchaeota archaeon]
MDRTKIKKHVTTSTCNIERGMRYIELASCMDDCGLARTLLLKGENLMIEGEKEMRSSSKYQQSINTSIVDPHRMRIYYLEKE